MDSKTKTAAQITLHFITSLDSDFDGIIDEIDQCKVSPETYNQISKTDDGCPDFVGDDKGIPDTDGDRN